MTPRERFGMTATERAALRGIRVVPTNPGPEFKPGPRVPRSWATRIAQLVKQLKERR